MAPEYIGKYRIESELGRGGMAIVYAAMDPVIQRPVAIKVVTRADLDPAESHEVLSRFKREAQAAGALNHPNIVSIYEYGENETHAWIVMERVDGPSLLRHLRGGYRPEPDRLPAVLGQLLEALDYSHSRGVVHRDVKPGNVLMTSEGAAKISDFGIARINRASYTQFGHVLGTPHYMAPEQYNGEQATERTDIYAAAVLIYEVLCARRPFEGQGGHLMKQILEADATPPSAIDARLPPDLDRVLAQALAKRHEDRYASAGEFLGELRRAYESKSAPAAVAARPGMRLAGNAGALRRALGAAAGAKPAGATAAVVKRPSVLCLDDEERVLNAIALVLQESFDVETVTSGAEALERIKARRFHVVISDQRMPGMTGVEFLRQAKTLAPTMVRILLTGYSDLSAIVGSVNEGEVFRFLNKPWQTESLRETVNEAADIAIAVEAAGARGGPPPKVSAVVLALGDTAMGRAAREMARGRYRVMDAPDLDEALPILAREDVGTLVFDLDVQGSDDPAALLRVLKGQSPRTQFVVVSDANDSELIISLINEARIHKFLKKPVNYSLLEQAVGEGLERYERMRETPELARTEAPRHAGETASSRSILSRLKSLGGRFAAALRGDTRG
ncbi:MAG: response regulator [Betaproteobacteria bacterium]|nr:response regulator [Betaproteobacteria bacterium]